MFNRRSLQEGAARRNRQVSLPLAPGGLNTKVARAAMPLKFSPLQENILSYPDGVKLRKGQSTWVTGLTNPAKALWTWDGPSSSKMFVTCDNGVFDVSTAGAVGAAVAALTAGATRAVNVSTGAANYLIICNAVDDIWEYDGTTWTSVAAMGTLNTNTVLLVESYKQRLFLVKEESLSLWYLGTNAVTGAATEYPLGAILRRGGAIQAIATWTIDAGNGPDDHLVVATSAGEVAVFTGTNPASSADWSLVGVYYLSAPLGNLALLKWGGDLLLLTESGVYPLSKALQTASIDRTRSLTENIQPTLATLVETYRDNFGWQLQANPAVPFLLLNIPGAAGGVQYVMHAQTGAWTKFTGWVANCWVRFGDDLFFGGAETIEKAWTGTADNGAPIRGKMLTAFSYVGGERLKRLRSARVVFSAEAPFDYIIGVANDYNFNWTGSQVYPNMPRVARWGQAYWGEDFWSGAEKFLREWRDLVDRPGVAKALYLEVWSATTPIAMQGVDVLVLDEGTY